VQIVRSGEAVAAVFAGVRKAGRLALVPTMGALHAGHLALIAEGRKRAERVAATIFVNPLQFNDAGDLQRYPRSEAEDLSKLEAAGCDLVWLPNAEDLFPAGFATTVSVKGVSERWEGEHRPGHFDGVATIVAKLLAATLPDLAIFGEKDFQQLALIRRMVTDLGFNTEIAGLATVRDDDGLALSSRNALLSANDRLAARALPRALNQARVSILGGEPVVEALAKARQQLADAGFVAVDYFALVDAATLEPVDALTGEELRLIAAATIDNTRLIDNLPVRATMAESR
jgi:pantoate--beta-alanine ligase